MAAEFVRVFVAAIKLRSRCGRVNYNSLVLPKARIFSLGIERIETIK